ncbi:putative spore coat protein, CotF-like protein [Gottschalkia purinilytica]|uniref:Putative spore coat protein, CotF-like protein n=1 Tax=Gottschalkia purinilytica TaxID=1503 RepID=A0A0L0WF42_GOTPU|nr:spore coat protein [Gottschalkia purinilytica]KNF10103.1 putative spore coat protein, CotF-like protein [Gottschalkia purinilytica]
MSSIKEMLGKKATNLSDKTIVNDTLAGMASASNAYLAATLKTATPELKQLFSSNLTQMLGEHAALSEMAINKEWITPYENPENQLLKTFNHSKEVLNSSIDN